MTRTPLRMRVERPSVTDYTTFGNSYADVPFTKEGSTDTRVYWDAWHLAGVKILHFFATTKDLKVQILGSIDGANFDTTLFAEFTLTAGSSSPVEKRIVAYWPYIKVQVKPSASSQHGTLSVRAIGTAISGEVDTEITATIDPTGLATALAQEEGNASLESIDDKLPALVGGKIPVDAGISGGTISVAPVRAAGVLHRSAVAAADKLAVAATPTNADAGAIAGGNLNGTYYSAVCAGNSFGPSGISAASSSIAIGTGHLCDVTIAQVTGAEHYDIFFGDNNTTHLLHLGRITEAQRAAGGATLLTAETVGTSGGNAAGTVRIGAVGAGLLASAVQFSQNNAYVVPTPAAAIDCNGKSYVDIFASLTITDLRSAPSLGLMPIFKSGQTPAGYFCGSPISVPIMNGSVGQSKKQMYRIDVEDMAELIIAVGTISGQGASVDIWAEAI